MRQQHRTVESAGQGVLFGEEGLLPSMLPRQADLRPSRHLSAVFEDCHNYIYANEGLLKEKIFQEMVKLLLMKLVDEQKTPDQALQFAITAEEYREVLKGSAERFLARMNALFALVKRTYPHLLSEDDKLALRPLTVAYIVSRLQTISLTQTPGDVKGEAFQSFVYRHQRGDRGEFFTPYPIVRLAVKMINPQPHEKVIDPACGSGGFLIETIAYVERQCSTWCGE